MINNNINPTLDYLIDDAYPFDITGIYSLYNQYFTKNDKYPTEVNNKINNSEEIMLVSRENSNNVIGFIDGFLLSFCRSIYVRELCNT